MSDTQHCAQCGEDYDAREFDAVLFHAGHHGPETSATGIIGERVMTQDGKWLICPSCAGPLQWCGYDGVAGFCVSEPCDRFAVLYGELPKASHE